MYIAYVRKEKSVETLIRSLFSFMVVMILGVGVGGVLGGNVWGQSQQYMSYFDDEAFFTRSRSLARMIQHTFSNLHQNFSEIVSVDEIMGNKMNMMIGQRISRLEKIRRKRDFSLLYCNAAFFLMRGNLKMRLPCMTKFLLLLCSWLQAVVRESPQGTQCTTFVLQFFSGYFFFYYSKQSKHVFAS